MSDKAVIENGSIRFSLVTEGKAAVGYTVDVRDGAEWRQMAGVSPLSRLVYRDKAGNRQVAGLVDTGWATGGPGILHVFGKLVDVDGIQWAWAARFRVTDEPNQIEVYYRLANKEGGQVLDWRGPALQVGADLGGAPRDEALFPGLEYLLDGEPSSDTRFAAEKYANRTVPHPYRITIPLMAVAAEGRAVGLLWDPNQDWHNAWRHPAAVFSAPDRVNNAGAAWMALAAPAVEPRWRNEGELEAHNPCGIGPGGAFELTARLVAVPDGGVLGIVREWLAAYGVPALPQTGITEDYRGNVALCVESYLEQAWDDDAEGWHHTLSDPWGPRFEAHLANQLWRYARSSQGDPELRQAARRQVERGVARARSLAAEEGKPPAVPHIELAAVYGHAVDALDSLAAAARAAMAEQQADGSWPWKPAAVADGSLKTAERLSLMGREGDSATGFTASKVRPVLQYALITRNADAVASVTRAADWCNRQRRPEGAQAWELHLHVPDVLAAPWLIDLNLGLFELTRDGSYLDAATRWAWSGLPFTYLWNAYYRPVMRYGTVPVFGVTFHDIQSWFGVIVQWNGLDYAASLFRLARYRPTDGPADWRVLAEGITRHGMQEQMREGKWRGMYPDAFSPVKGDEEYTWWLNPQLIGINTFPLAGLPVSLEPVVLPDRGASVHVSSGAVVQRAVRDGSGIVHVSLQDEVGESSVTFVAGRDKPSAVMCGSQRLPEVADLDAAAEGWQWLDAHRVAAIKVSFAAAGVAITVSGV
jgi:hypothetical protein